MNTLTKILSPIVVVAGLGMATAAQAAEYMIDTAGAHASINFRVNHLGFSWLAGRFDTFDGEFSFDAKDPAASAITVNIDTNSVNSNHAERDNHLRSADFLDVSNHPTASFVSTGIEVTGDKTAVITGDLTLRGVTKAIEIEAEYIGGGQDPWGGNRQGFMGTTSFTMADFGIDFDLGPASRDVELTLHVEGIQK